MNFKLFGVFVFDVYVYLYRVEMDTLALLDHVSRAHGMGVFVRRLSSVVRPSVATIISEPIPWIPFKFWSLHPLGHMPDPFFN